MESNPKHFRDKLEEKISKMKNAGKFIVNITSKWQKVFGWPLVDLGKTTANITMLG